MTIALAMVAVGGLLVYCAWTNRSVLAAARGDNTVAKPGGSLVPAGQGSGVGAYAGTNVNLANNPSSPGGAAIATK